MDILDSNLMYSKMFENIAENQDYSDFSINCSPVAINMKKQNICVWNVDKLPFLFGVQDNKPYSKSNGHLVTL